MGREKSVLGNVPRLVILLQRWQARRVIARKEMTQDQSVSTGQMNSKSPGNTCSERPQKFPATFFEHWCKYKASLAPQLRIQYTAGLAIHTICLYT